MFPSFIIHVPKQRHTYNNQTVILFTKTTPINKPIKKQEYLQLQGMKEKVPNNLSFSLKQECERRGDKIPDKHLIIIQWLLIPRVIRCHRPHWTPTIRHDRLSQQPQCLLLHLTLLLLFLSLHLGFTQTLQIPHTNITNNTINLNPRPFLSNYILIFVNPLHHQWLHIHTAFTTALNINSLKVFLIHTGLYRGRKHPGNNSTTPTTRKPTNTIRLRLAKTQAWESKGHVVIVNKARRGQNTKRVCVGMRVWIEKL